MCHYLTVRHAVVSAFLAMLVGVLGCSDVTSNPTGPTAATNSTVSGNSAGSGAVVGANGSAGPGNPGTSTPAGTVSVRLTDSPFSDAQAVLVTFSEVSVHRSGGDWETLPFVGGSAGRTCDLKRLQGPSDVLGVGPLPAGDYTQIRLTVAAAAIYFGAPSVGGPCAVQIAAPAGEHWPVDVPSGIVKLNREFTVTGGGATTILLDLDGDRSIKQTGPANGNGSPNGNSHGNGNGDSGTQKSGRYIMTPVIGVLSVQ
jgi:hypothetical protein